MTKSEPEFIVGYIGAHLRTYYAEEYNLFTSSVEGLQRLGEELGFHVVFTETPIDCASEASIAIDNMISKGVDFVLLHHATFLMGDIVMEIAKRRIPLGLWTHPEPTSEGEILFNGFVSIDMSASIIRRYLRDESIGYKWFYGDTSHHWFRDRLATTVTALRGKKALHNGSIGLIGGIAPTFYNFTFDERRMADLMGVGVGHHELKEIFDRISEVDTTRIRKIGENIRSRTGNLVEVSQRDLDITSSIYAALDDFASDHHYSALAVSDWPAFQAELDIHPGFAFSWLEDQKGVPVASEGDVMGAATMILMRNIALEEAYLLDMAAIDTDKEAMLMWHCGGSPLGLANDAGVRCLNHAMLGRKVPDSRRTGAVADFVFRNGPVTVSRLSDDGHVMFVFDAEVVSTDSVGYEGCRGWITNFRAD
ncbi:MAG: hypothetical protein CL398_03100, partial [Acidiferrobacteraceae bacterium]|nr:hypothetical protein [Acidiferrobacteraceae bacterium]